MRRRIASAGRSRPPKIKTIRSAGPAVFAACALMLAEAAIAQTTSNFNLPAQSLARSLRIVAGQTNSNILFDRGLVQTMSAPPLRGDFTTAEALEKLLEGTGLTYRNSDDKTVTIVAEQPALRLRTTSLEQGSIHLAQADDEPLPQRLAQADVGAPPGPAAAPEEAPPQDMQEVAVTGSRIVRDGYEAPTPLTVVGTEALARAADSNVTDTLATMPVFSGGQTTRSGAGVPSFNQAGISSVNLRNIGQNRTLVLLDGQRVVGSVSTGIVDVDNFPQQLISRVEVVTGGASAVYGSDAVSGVVNFILDRKFTGFKGEISGGGTSYGDDRNYKISLADGFSFAGGRGHVLLSGEFNNNDGIVYGNGSRAWAKTATNYYVNPAFAAGNGQPEFLLGNNVFLSQATHGGLITGGPLKGIAFGQGGVPYQFNYGTTVARDLFMSGGDYKSTLTDTAYSLDPKLKRENVFGRVSYDVTDNTNVFLQVSHGSTDSFGLAFPHYSAGAGVTIKSGNPFIPASVQQQMTALGVATIPIGSMNYDMPFVSIGTTRATNRYVLGAEGKFDLFSSKWNWNSYVEIGRTTSDYNTFNVENTQKYALALDAVRNPATGSIVCRSTLTNPNNGCVPWNPMGTGVNGVAALDYLMGTAHATQSTGQDVYAASVTGEPFHDWAGPVSIALSAEHRNEKATVESDPISQQGLWRSGNLQPLDAQFHVSEAAAETVIPLLNNKPFAENWDLNAAFRAAEYEYSGYVPTYKVGTTYQPIQDLRFRATWSRDIRAPNISELFQRQNQGLTTDFDPLTGNTVTHGRTVVGNPALEPEKADSKTVGVVVQPRFIPGLTFSVDYWDIDIKGAIIQLSSTQVITFCYSGVTALCPNITRDPATNNITTVQLVNFNFASQKANGVDFDASYNFSLDSLFQEAPGDVNLHVAATRYIHNITSQGVALPDDSDGTIGGTPNDVLTATATYSLPTWQFSVTERAFSRTVLDNDYIQCASGCPTSTVDKRTFDQLGVAGGSYLDVAIAYKLENLFGKGDGRLFLNVRNLFDRDPALTPQIGTSGLGYIYSRSQNGRWDKLGRVLRVGVDFKF